MIRWSPNSELANLHGAMDRLFEDFFGGSANSNGGNQQVAPAYFLPLDVREVGDGYEIQAPVPGFKQEEVEITFSEGVLRIRAQHSEESSKPRGAYLRKEVVHGSFHRSIQLPGDVKADDIAATFEDGLLTVSVPKAPRPEPKKIQVSGGSRKQLGGGAS